MPIDVSRQAYIFICSVVGGMSIALLYDLFRIKRRAIKTHAIFIYFEDLLYWIFVAVVMLGVLYYSNDGEIRGFIFLGSVLGVVLYVILFSKAVMNISMFIIGLIRKLFKIAWTIILFPVKIVYRIISIPVRLIIKLILYLLKFVRRIGKWSIRKFSGIKRTVRNIKNMI